MVMNQLNYKLFSIFQTNRINILKQNSTKFSNKFVIHNNYKQKQTIINK